MHTKECLDAIPKSVAISKGCLTTRTAENENTSISDIYPKVHDALIQAGLLKGDEKLPKLGRLLDKRTEEME